MKPPRLNLSQQRHLSEIYKRSFRQIWRWLWLGLKAGDPCPIFEPKKMPAWRERMRERMLILRPPQISKMESIEKLYGCRYNRVWSWLRRGRENGEACPILQPGLMRAWWQRNMKKPMRQDLSARLPGRVFDPKIGANLYGRKPGTISKWRARGLQNSDRFPLFQPEEMRAWWHRNMKNRMSQDLSARLNRIAADKFRNVV
jgi:hypothetical protein